jgi:hypothetical protein
MTDSTDSTSNTDATPTREITTAGQKVVADLRAKLVAMDQDERFVDVQAELDRQFEARVAEAAEKEQDAPNRGWNIVELVQLPDNQLIRNINAIESAERTFVATKESLELTDRRAAVLAHPYVAVLFGGFADAINDDELWAQLRDRKVRGNLKFVLSKVEEILDRAESQIKTICEVAGVIDVEFISADEAFADLAVYTTATVRLPEDVLAERGLSSEISCHDVADWCQKDVGFLEHPAARKASAFALKNFLKRTGVAGDDEVVLGLIRRLNEEVIFVDQESSENHTSGSSSSSSKSPEERAAERAERDRKRSERREADRQYRADHKGKQGQKPGKGRKA